MDLISIVRSALFSMTYPGGSSWNDAGHSPEIDEEVVEVSLKRLGGGADDGDGTVRSDHEVGAGKCQLPSPVNHKRPAPAPKRTPHMRSNDDGVPLMMITPRSLPAGGGFPNKPLAVVEEAPSSSTSRLGDGDLAWILKFTLDMDTRLPFHSRRVSQANRLTSWNSPWG